MTRRRFRRRRQGVRAVLLTGMVLLGGTLTPVGAQGMLEGTVRVGIVLPPVTGEDPLADAVALAASNGATMADEEFAFNAEMLGIDFAVVSEIAGGAEDVVAAAETLVEAGAFAVAGGFTAAEAEALARWSEARGVPYLNLGASDDALRHEQCAATAYHLEASAAMYLDALSGWYVRSGFRQWHFVVGDDDESQAQLERAKLGLRERHFGARPVGETVVSAGHADVSGIAAAVARSRADLVVMLLPAGEQLRVLAALDEAGSDVMVAGFPYPEAQTRTFYAASREAAPRLGVNHRASAWEATLDAYGAREINARFRMRFGEPMDAPAWAAYQAVKVAYEAAFFGGSTDADTVLAYLNAPTSVFDVWKGIGTTFRAWDGQLRQSLYLVKINESAEGAFTLATLVGELPAIYMPGTDPVERLDQLGDLAADSRCVR
jgi:ABC transporter substrate binding protein (PQQ-dependent alcohol dehydrogenase system)